jgi:tRNA U34 5-methylaminomethyl-2-thiouridine-forming methyltransferase MnmC
MRLWLVCRSVFPAERSAKAFGILNKIANKLIDHVENDNNIKKTILASFERDFKLKALQNANEYSDDELDLEKKQYWMEAVRRLEMELRKCAVVYKCDAFAYDTQPELWSREVFEQMAAMTKTGGVLVTYSSKGVVKQALRDAGFEVKRLPGACGKHHMLRAVKL